jgi:IS1 family transposase
MTCHSCRIEMVKAGTYGKKRIQRYKCQQCGKRFAEPQEKPLGPTFGCPVKRYAESSTASCKATACAEQPVCATWRKRTVLNLLTLAGENCERVLSEKVRNVTVRDLEMDEIWGFVQKKEGHKWPHEAHDTSIGDAYTFIALDNHSKLVVAWHLGRRDRINTEDFIAKVRTATGDCRFQVSTDAFGPYASAIETGIERPCRLQSGREGLRQT